jgi:invasion protein IalB
LLRDARTGINTLSGLAPFFVRRLLAMLSLRPDGRNNHAKPALRWRLGQTIAAAVFAAGTLLIGHAPANAMTRTEKTFGSWTVVCVENDNKPKRCDMVQSRVQADSKKVVLIWSIASDPDKGLIQAVTVPAGVSIKEGVRLFIGDGEPLTLAYDVCGPRYCVASTPLDPKVVASIKSAQKASASYVQSTRKLLQVNIEVTGFSDAYDYFTQQLS